MTAINSDRQLAHAADIIRNGGVIAYPTEGVWGLGCDPTLEAAVHKLLALVIILSPLIKWMIVTLSTLNPHSHKDLSHIFCNF